MTIHETTVRTVADERRTIRRAVRVLRAALGRGDVDPDVLAAAEMLLEVGGRRG
jgi:hypothetical protein